MKNGLIGVGVLGVLLLSGYSIPAVVYAHPGNTDASGCHTCRTNCPKWGLSTGEYHCHNAKALPQPKEPIRSHYDENGGTTEPWPEYKTPKQTAETNPSPAVKQKAPVAIPVPSVATTTQKSQENNIEVAAFAATPNPTPGKVHWFKRFFSFFF
ncbi:hypothetical protein COU18_00710 [Candidatus Kaiserbacteria bacterium CG10_big_fil_rev_8_21_14_0_10_51_14]|uniref:YHYH domain-containing protein n=1 Tax=Candidatus Kaiserbacteria bacterium CG10_big_fil_rev_8_21_14_0_10_51_14 TaxID=1974610 RepID=A0A2H0UBZ9_9BACT|nr:MAG: hypothetical protein COU18_00710 [Candidatus Kaiserbacteria bacterium CG10_big_fil_rev_8_21_14_0_10_51_14]